VLFVCVLLKRPRLYRSLGQDSDHRLRKCARPQRATRFLCTIRIGTLHSVTMKQLPGILFPQSRLVSGGHCPVSAVWNQAGCAA